MLENQRAYQFIMSKTNCRPLAWLTQIFAKGLGMACEALCSLWPEKPLNARTAAEAQAALTSFYPCPTSPLDFPPLPPQDENVALSVIVPVYNAEKSISACLDSILTQQTAETIALIVINDGSTDNTAALLEKYRDHALILTMPHSGSAAHVRNIGLCHATGRYVMFVDSDDRLCPGAVETLLTAAARWKADIVQGAWQYIKQDGKSGLVQTYAPGCYDGKHRCDRLDLPGMPWGKLYRRTLFEQVRFPEGYTAYEDSIVHFLLFRMAERVAVVPQTVYLWQQNPQGITVQNRQSTSALQSCWVVKTLLEMDAQLALPHDEMYARSLTMQLSHFCTVNLSALPREMQIAALQFCAALYEKALPEGWPETPPYAVRCAEKALRGRKLKRWLRQGRLFQLIR